MGKENDEGANPMTPENMAKEIEEVDPLCPRCGFNNPRHMGKSLIIPFSTPNRFFNPDIYTIELNNFTCEKCMKLLVDSINTWWKTGNYHKNLKQDRTVKGES